MRDNRVEIRLESVLGALTLTGDDPIGYNESETKIGRSEESHGIFITETNNLEFYGRAKQYLENLWELKSVSAKCRMIKKVRHPRTDEWQLHSDGYLDFYTRSIKNAKFQIDFVEGGLRELLTSQFRETFELNRETDIKGNSITPLKTDTLSLKGRDMYLQSRWSNKNNTDFWVRSGEWNSNEVREVFQPFPLEFVANSDEENIANPIESSRMDGTDAVGEQTMFFLIANRDRGRIELSFKGSFQINPDDYTAANTTNRELAIVLRKYTGGDAFNFDPADEVLIDYLGDWIGIVGNTITVDFSRVFKDATQVRQGESYAIGLKLRGVYGSGLNAAGRADLHMTNYEGSLSWAEDSFYRRTISDCLTAYNTGRRLSEIFTGAPCFESYLLEGKDPTLLTDANHEFVFAAGGWLRNLSKEIETKDEFGNVISTQEKPWPIEFSFEDFYKSIFATLPVGYGISTVGAKQSIVFESLRYFFQRVTTVKLGKITIKERSAANELCYQSLKFGYEKGGNYEQPLGLDEYNTQTDTITPLTGTDNEYNAVGMARTDSYGAEYTRRKQAKDFPDEDTNMDKDNFLFDVKKTDRIIGKDVFEPRLWADDFTTPPTGVYSPQTAFNLNLSPGWNRYRHSYWYNAAIYKLQDEALQFTNSKGNSDLKTFKVDRSLKENQPEVPVPELDSPIFEPEWIEAESEFQQEIMDQVLGKTLIDGRWVNNFYGMAEFINEQNKKEYAFIYEVKAKDKITYKLLKAHGV